MISYDEYLDRLQARAESQQDRQQSLYNRFLGQDGDYIDRQYESRLERLQEEKT